MLPYFGKEMPYVELNDSLCGLFWCTWIGQGHVPPRLLLLFVVNYSSEMIISHVVRQSCRIVLLPSLTLVCPLMWYAEHCELSSVFWFSSCTGINIKDDYWNLLKLLLPWCCLSRQVQFQLWKQPVVHWDSVWSSNFQTAGSMSPPCLLAVCLR